MTEPMNHDELSELVAAYALDAVEPDEVTLVEEHLAACPRCRAELAEHREVTALLAHTGAPAPDGVWDRIAASIDEGPTPAAPDLELGDVLPFRRKTEQAPPASRPERANRLAWVLGSAAAVIIALLGVQVARQDRQLSDVRAQLETRTTDSEVDLLLRDQDAEVVELASPSGELLVRAVVDDDGRGFLLAHALPELPAGKTYQLWGVGATEQPLSLGLLGQDPRTVEFTMLGGISGLAVTAEDAPGVVVSQQDPVVVGEIA